MLVKIYYLHYYKISRSCDDIVIKYYKISRSCADTVRCIKKNFKDFTCS